MWANIISQDALDLMVLAAKTISSADLSHLGSLY
jgi:hypothetical protein